MSWHDRAINSIQYTKDWRGLRDEYLKLAAAADQSEELMKAEIERLKKLLDEYRIPH